MQYCKLPYKINVLLKDPTVFIRYWQFKESNKKLNVLKFEGAFWYCNCKLLSFIIISFFLMAVPLRPLLNICSLNFNSSRWIMRAFSGYFPPTQLLYLWDLIIGYDSLEVQRVVCPTFRHPVLTSSFTKYRFLQVKIDLQQLWMDCQLWNCFSFWMVIYYFRGMPTASIK